MSSHESPEPRVWGASPISSPITVGHRKRVPGSSVESPSATTESLTYWGTMCFDGKSHEIRPDEIRTCLALPALVDLTLIGGWTAPIPTPDTTPLDFSRIRSLTLTDASTSQLASVITAHMAALTQLTLWTPFTQDGDSDGSTGLACITAAPHLETITFCNFDPMTILGLLMATDVLLSPNNTIRTISNVMLLPPIQNLIGVNGHPVLYRPELSSDWENGVRALRAKFPAIRFTFDMPDSVVLASEEDPCLKYTHKWYTRTICSGTWDKVNAEYARFHKRVSAMQ